jgi:hypothetical protein
MAKLWRSGNVDIVTRIKPTSRHLAKAAEAGGKVVLQVAKTPMHPAIKAGAIVGACVVAVGVGVWTLIRSRRG